MAMLCEQIGLKTLGYPVVVDAQNIADYWKEHGKDHSYEWAGLPGCTPPWPLVWVEFNEPGESGRRVGVRVETEVIDKPSVLRLLHFRFASPYSGPPIKAEAITALDCDGVMRVAPFLAPIGTTADDLRIRATEETDISVSDDEKFTAVMLTTMAVMTFVFANCRNVTVRDEKPKMTRQQRRHGPPAIAYKVLDIAPMTRVLRDEGDIEHNGIKKALHICRGHFSHYTSEAPLFGKYEGTFWTPMHLRGSAKQGVVVKDYNVMPRELER